MLKLALPLTLAIAAGISLVVQQALNANLRTALSSAAWSGFMSYFLGVVCMAAFAFLLQDPGVDGVEQSDLRHRKPHCVFDLAPRNVRRSEP